MYISRLIITAIVFAILSGPVFAGNNGKITICHNGETITISNSALSTHVNNHGDYVGECDVEVPAPINLVLMIRCNNDGGQILVSGVSFSGATATVYPGLLPVVGNNCAEANANAMNDGLFRSATGAGNGETEYLYIMEN